ncbi:MAG: hypothetical protein HKN92_09040 [Chitinophagales bacterium]|nr:hypothetical protein [Chitinophagales bacterium]
MRLKLLNIVVFAENYEELLKWYQDTFKLEILLKEDGEYHYTELGNENQVIVGITPAKEINHQPENPRNNSTILQVEVSDIQELFKNVVDNGGKVIFGPSLEEQHKFYYGGVTDIEGNQIWIIEEKTSSM